MIQLQDCTTAMKKEDVGNGVEMNKSSQQAKILSIKPLMENGVILLQKIHVKLGTIAKTKQSVSITVQQDGDNDTFYLFI